MNELRIYIVMRNGEPIAAFSTPQAASTFLIQQPLEEGRYTSPYKLRSVIVQDMVGTELMEEKQ